MSGNRQDDPSFKARLARLQALLRERRAAFAAELAAVEAGTEVWDVNDFVELMISGTQIDDDGKPKC
jgi:hypothetical protein